MPSQIENLIFVGVYRHSDSAYFYLQIQRHLAMISDWVWEQTDIVSMFEVFGGRYRSIFDSFPSSGQGSVAFTNDEKEIPPKFYLNTLCGMLRRHI